MRTLSGLLSLCLVFVVVSFLSPSFACAAPNFTEGMWEMKGEVKFDRNIRVQAPFRVQSKEGARLSAALFLAIAQIDS